MEVRAHGVRAALNPVTGSFIGRRHTETQRRDHVKSEAKSSVMHLQAEEPRRLVATTRDWERGKEHRILLQSLQQEPNDPGDTLISDLWLPELGENTFLVF